MIRLLAAIRSLGYGAGFVLLWGWIACKSTEWRAGRCRLFGQPLAPPAPRSW
jgi:hypothetical protein